jgi:hypothetical protein
MDDLDERLDRWTSAGLLTAEQADAITRFEGRRSAGARNRAAAPQSETRPDRRSLGAEAVGYVGAALAIGAIAVLLGDVWDQLFVGGRIALVALLTVLLAAGGVALRRDDRPPLQRLTSLLFSGAVIGVGWCALIVAEDVLGLREEDVALIVGVAAAAAAWPAYVTRRRALPQLTLLASLLVTIGAVFSRSPLPLEPVWGGLTFWTAGIAWLLLGTGRWIQPRRVAEVAGGVVALLAIQVASFDDARRLTLTLAVVTAAGLVMLAITSDRVHHLAVGAVALFVFVPQLVTPSALRQRCSSSASCWCCLPSELAVPAATSARRRAGTRTAAMIHREARDRRGRTPPEPRNTSSSTAEHSLAAHCRRAGRPRRRRRAAVRRQATTSAAFGQRVSRPCTLRGHRVDRPRWRRTLHPRRPAGRHRHPDPVRFARRRVVGLGGR